MIHSWCFVATYNSLVGNGFQLTHAIAASDAWSEQCRRLIYFVTGEGRGLSHVQPIIAALAKQKSSACVNAPAVMEAAPHSGRRDSLCLQTMHFLKVTSLTLTLWANKEIVRFRTIQWMTVFVVC